MAFREGYHSRGGRDDARVFDRVAAGRECACLFLLESGGRGIHVELFVRSGGGRADIVSGTVREFYFASAAARLGSYRDGDGGCSVSLDAALAVCGHGATSGASVLAVVWSAHGSRPLLSRGVRATGGGA